MSYWESLKSQEFRNLKMLCRLFGHRWGEWRKRSRKVVAEQRGWDSVPYWMMLEYRERTCSRCDATEEGKV